MIKQLKFAALSVMAALLFSACSEDEPVSPKVNTATSGALIINQGNAYSGLSGSLSAYSFSDSSITHNVFAAVNKKGLGDNPQYGISYGNHVYICEFKGNHVWVMSRDSLKVEKEIRTPQPEDITAWSNYLYVANNDGFVTRVNIYTSDTSRLYVGPNPSNILTANNAIYVSVSDGWNARGNYQNGKKVTKINPLSFKIEKEIEVGINPGKLTADQQGNVFVVSRGNYGGNTESHIAAIEPMIYKISTNNTAQPFAKGTDIAIEQNKAYTIYNYTNWVTYETTLTYNIYDTQTGKKVKENFIMGDAPKDPIAMAIEPKTKQLYITSRPQGMDYNHPGFLYIYTLEGKPIKKLQTGVEPYAVFFR